ncbi:hypothetical protein TVAG_228680 [Trichomonas vaginalis G3]|uniref:Intimal thickness related receptor IRP domain-containing protein n=1 Tax=Trichomonas vaginalis (strain ATCC PRA-98 / G3) TaxID=412133 RepID=A2DJ30_TRIV3|nr:transmembrane protein 181 family [Trichomonas vaginalis G3]EAY19605.1 hypothetical protein TVAG_228680 [Trichomonas vaginalis G3]KAI5515045.1 transmembrane protein 181 family [Trichomonas vaginalis G3]|eukprot:XP_001580591.1 hypothetical protein [Trichomonas vaginalis G3]
MRAKVPDEQTQATPLETMTTPKAIAWIVCLTVFIVLSCVVSFSSKNTNYQVKSDLALAIPQTTVANSAQFKRFTPLSSFAVLSFKAYTASEVKDFEIKFRGTTRLYNKQMQQISIRDINISRKVNCKDKVCDEVNVMTYNFVNFSAISFVGYVSSDVEIFRRVDLMCTSLNSGISIAFFILISAMTVALVIVLIFVVPRRLYPSRPDHWGVLYLAIAAVCIDGPWLLFKYYAASWFSNIYDIMPEIFHIVFIMFIMALFNGLTNGWANRIFGSWIISGVIAFGLCVVIVLSSIATSYAPLNASSIFLSESVWKIPIYIITISMHLIIFSICVLGVANIQIINDYTLILTELACIYIECFDILRVFLRFFCPRQQLGLSFAADVLYILNANFITIFFLANNLPVSLAINAGEDLQEAMIPDEAPATMDVDTSNL